MNEVPYYRDSKAHVRDELQKLDLLIKRLVLSMRLEQETVPERTASHPMYISLAEVDRVLASAKVSAPRSASMDQIDKELEDLQRHMDVRLDESRNQGVFLTLPRLARLFRLSRDEIQAVVMCLAPELDRKYDRLYAYLQDDITRKKPSVQLWLDLLCLTEEEKWQALGNFANSALIHAGILRKIDDPQSPSGSSALAQFLRLDPRILGFLLGDNTLDEQVAEAMELLHALPTMDEVSVDPDIKAGLLAFIEHHFSKDSPGGREIVLHFHGPYGIGKQELARGICGQLNTPLLCLDTEFLLSRDPYGDRLLKAAFREGLLLQTPLYFTGTDLLLAEDDRAKVFVRILAGLVKEYGWLTFLAGEKPWQRFGSFAHINFHSVRLPLPDIPLRKEAWQRALHSLAPNADLTWIGQLSSRFRLTPGQIRNAVAWAKREQELGGDRQEITLPELFKACRQQSDQKLRELALKITPRYKWKDLVLPEDKITQLLEICGQVKHQHRVFGEWGFGRKISHGRGLSVLFSGPSGTGKTMAAEVIAHELHLDLYKIDLSGVVSKYIGETEKNLDKVFREAEICNAVLFFDEADALFGKRTKVNDAHDRYANIETSYLLQKMEEYEGVVILSSNLQENLDEAFIRRIRAIVEFPFPDEANRMKIWMVHFPEEAPLSEKIDYPYLARKLQIAGGNIRNIVLHAAFLAAENGGGIGMDHVLRGARREFEKIGKLLTKDLFDKAATAATGQSYGKQD